jgi:hypothetical protein
MFNLNKSTENDKRFLCYGISGRLDTFKFGADWCASTWRCIDIDIFIGFFTIYFLRLKKDRHTGVEYEDNKRTKRTTKVRVRRGRKTSKNNSRKDK